jgi:hypothetical protein
MAKAPKRPRDPNKLARMIVDLATGDAADPAPVETTAAELGRLGGIKGGNARAAALTPERKTEIARRAAAKRWQKA